MILFNVFCFDSWPPKPCRQLLDFSPLHDYRVTDFESLMLTKYASKHSVHQARSVRDLENFIAMLIARISISTEVVVSAFEVAQFQAASCNNPIHRHNILPSVIIAYPYLALLLSNACIVECLFSWNIASIPQG
jgi:hypothetical protein